MAKVLVDIDGVLNPFRGANLIQRGFTELSTNSWTTWMLHTKHQHWLKELSHYADLVWASSWEEESQQISRLWGLVDMPFICFDSWKSEPTLKLPDIREYAAQFPGEKIVWLDDELESDAFEWAQIRPNTLLVHCDPAVGWTQEQFAQTKAFLLNDPS